MGMWLVSSAYYLFGTPRGWFLGSCFSATCGEIIGTLLICLLVYLIIYLLTTWIWTVVLPLLGWHWYSHHFESMQHTICDVQALRELILLWLTLSLPLYLQWSQEPFQFVILLDPFLPYIHWHWHPFQYCLGILILPLFLTLGVLPLPLPSFGKMSSTLIKFPVPCFPWGVFS